MTSEQQLLEGGVRRKHTHGVAVYPGTKVFQPQADSSTQEPAGWGVAAETLLASLCRAPATPGLL